MTSRGVRLLVPVLAVMVGLAVSEFLLRTVFRVAPQVDLNIYARDETDNLRLIPNLEKHHVTPLWDIAVRTNSEGWRDEPGEPATDILGLGDSFAFGWGVEESEGLFRLLEIELGRQVLNAAVPGTSSPDQAHLLETHFSGATPETVLLALFVGNDFVEARRGGTKLFAVENGRLTYMRSHSGRLARALDGLRSLRVVQLLRALQFRYGFLTGDGSDRNWDDWMQSFAEIHLRNGDSDRLFGPAAAGLERVARWCDLRGSRLRVIVIPRSWQIEVSGLQEMMQALEISPAQIDLDRPQRFLTRWGAAHGVEMIDLLPSFRQDFADEPGLRLYHTPDAHWTAAGHALAARTVTEAMRSAP